MDYKALWTLIFSGVGVGLLVIVTYLVKKMHAHTTGVAQGDIGVIVRKMDANQEALRKQMSSNHDEVDGELRAISENTLATQRDLEAERKRRISEETLDELSKLKRKASDDTH